MRSISRVRVALAALTLLGFTPAAPSAPVPRPGGPSVPKLEKYLPDDTDFVLLVNVKQVLASPLYKKNFEKLVEEFLKQPAAQAILKDAGFDPLKDVEWASVYAGRSSHPTEGMPPSGNDGPVFALHGKFDGARLHAKMAKLAKENPGQVQVHKLGGTSVYELKALPGPTGFGAVLDRNTLVLAPRKEQVAEALEKAAGKKKTKLTVKAIPAALKKLKPDLAVQAVAAEQMIISSSYSSTAGPGGAPAVTKVTHHTLGDSGLTGFRVAVAVKDDARGTVTLGVKNEEVKKKITDGFEEFKREGKREAERRASLAPLIKMLEAVKVKPGKDAVTFEGRADAEAIKAIFGGLFGVRGP